MHKELVLRNRIEEVAQLEGFIETLGEELTLDIPLCFNLNLALEEAVTNVINYAFPPEEEHSFLVSADGEAEGTLTLEIQDDGVAFDPLNEAPEVDITLGVEERPIGGLGIFLVKQIMDEVSYERVDGKNILTMKKCLKS